VSVSPLAVSRALLGALFLARTTPVARIFGGIHAHIEGPLLGWPDGAPIHVAVFPLPNALVAALCIARTAAAALFLLGFRTRAAGLVTAAASWLVLSQDPFNFVFTLHAMTLAIFVYAFATSSRNPDALVRLFIASIYFWSAVPKMQGAWLSGATLRAFHALGFGGNALGALFMDRFARETAVATVVVELSLGPLLLVRRTRTFALALAVVMHALFEGTLHPDVFGWAMIALLAALWPRHSGIRQ